MCMPLLYIILCYPALIAAVAVGRERDIHHPHIYSDPGDGSFSSTVVTVDWLPPHGSTVEYSSASAAENPSSYSSSDEDEPYATKA